jgi:hypothetical protein
MCNSKIERQKCSYKKLFFMALTLLLMSGCGAMRSYDAELKQTVELTSNGQLDKALLELEKNNTSTEKDLLYFDEKGQLLNLNGQFAESRDAWLMADEKIKAWESEVKTDPVKLMGDFSSVIVNDKTRRYDGQDYEKVLLSTKLAINHLQLGDWDAARIEIKKTHEREAIIAEFRAKEIEKVEEEAKKNKVTTELKDLKGYPVETLNDPEVTILKNGYQSAFSHYLSGFVYESLKEPSLAAPGYRKAIELRPDIKWLEDGLANMESREHGIKRKETDVLFVIETGSVPARQSVNFPIPIPTNRTLIAVPLSFPVIRPDTNVFLPHEITLDNQTPVNVYPVTSLDAMARRALKDDMPGILVRGTIRAIAKTAAQAVASDRNVLVGLAVSVAAVATESADERAWRTLPSHILIGRATLPAGEHVININTPLGLQSANINIAGKHAIVDLRLLGNKLYLTQPIISPQMLSESEAIQEAPEPSTVSKEKKPTKSKQAKKKRS